MLMALFLFGSDVNVALTRAQRHRHNRGTSKYIVVGSRQHIVVVMKCVAASQHLKTSHSPRVDLPAVDTRFLLSPEFSEKAISIHTHRPSSPGQVEGNRNVSREIGAKRLRAPLQRICARIELISPLPTYDETEVHRRHVRESSSSRATCTHTHTSSATNILNNK